MVAQPYVWEKSGFISHIKESFLALRDYISLWVPPGILNGGVLLSNETYIYFMGNLFTIEPIQVLKCLKSSFFGYSNFSTFDFSVMSIFSVIIDP